MVICLEEISESNREEAKEKGTMLSMANQWQKQSGSVLLQTNHSLSVTFLRDFNGVLLLLLLLYQYFFKRKSFNLCYTSLFFSIPLNVENICLEK